MLFECIAIFGIILAIMIIFLRTKRKYAVLTAPLLLIPGANILSYFFSEKLSYILPFDHFFVFLLINITALLISGILIGIASNKLTSRSAKISYEISFVLFNIILSAILVYNLYYSV